MRPRRCPVLARGCLAAPGRALRGRSRATALTGRALGRETLGDDPAMSRAIDIPEYDVKDEVRVDPARTALIVIDMQNDFVRDGGSLRVPDAEATIPAISALLGLARGQGMRVVYSQDTHRDGDPEWRGWAPHCRGGGWGGGG